jgi:hypothetical protein
MLPAGALAADMTVLGCFGGLHAQFGIRPATQLLHLCAYGSSPSHHSTVQLHEA